MGYHSSVYIQGFDAVRYPDGCRIHSEKEETNLILKWVAIGTLSYDTGNIAYYASPPV